MKIAFWSPMHGTGATANLLAVGMELAFSDKLKTLVTQTHFAMNNLEMPLLGRNTAEEFFQDTGLDAVMRHFKSGELTEKQITNCSIKIGSELYLLAGTRISNKESYENQVIQSMVTRIISVADRYYDLVMIDTNSGCTGQSYEIMNECDLMVVNLRQDRNMIEAVIKDEFFRNKRIFYLFGNYDASSKYNLNNIRRLYKSINKNNSAGIIYNTDFMDAITDGNVLDYYAENMNADEDFYDMDFFKSVRETVSKLLDYIGGGKP